MRKILLSFLFIIVFAPLAASAEPVTDETLNSLIILSRVEDQLDQYPGITKQGFRDSAMGQMKNANVVFGAFDDAVDQELRPADLLATLKNNLKSQLTEAQAQETIDWLTTDLGQKILEAEIEASQVSSPQQIQNAAQDLIQDKEGMMIAAEINKAINGTFLMMSLQEKSMSSSMKALEKLQPEDQRMTDKEIDEIVNVQLSQSLNQIDQIMVLTFAYTYRDISGDEKMEYLKFLLSPTGQKFSEITNISLIEALSDSYEKLAGTFLKNLQDSTAAQ